MLFKQYLAIIEGTFREARSKKTLVGFLIFSTLVILIAFFIFQQDAIVSALHNPASTNKKDVLEIGATVLDSVWTAVSMLLLFMTIFVGVFATANFITSIMEKGTIDLLISKPVPRWLYIVGRFSGSMLIMLGEVAYLIIGLWLVVGASSGMWNARFLLNIFFIWITFGGIYSIVVLLSVITKSSMLALIGSFVIYVIVGLLLPLAAFIDKLLNGEGHQGVLYYIGKGAQYVIPRIQEIAPGIAKFTLGGELDAVPFLFTLLLTGVYLGLSTYIFSKKEF